MNCEKLCTFRTSHCARFNLVGASPPKGFAFGEDTPLVPNFGQAGICLFQFGRTNYLALASPSATVGRNYWGYFKARTVFAVTSFNIPVNWRMKVDENGFLYPSTVGFGL